MAIVVGDLGPHQLTGLKAVQQHRLQVVAAGEHLGQIDAIGQGTMGRPNRNAIGQGQIPHGRTGAELPIGRPTQILHRTQPGVADGGQRFPAEPLTIKGSVVGHQHICSCQQFIEPTQGPGPGLRQPCHGSWDPVDRFRRIGLHRQEKGLLRQNRSSRDVKQNRPDFETTIPLRIKPGGFSVDDQRRGRPRWSRWIGTLIRHRLQQGQLISHWHAPCPQVDCLAQRKRFSA